MLFFLSIIVGVAILLSALGLLPYNPQDILAQTIFLLAICWGTNALLARIVNTKPNSESSLITGLILTAIVGPVSLPGGLIALAAIAVAAMGSKYLFVINESHVFNPAAFGVIVGALFLGSPASWWIGSKAMAPFILAGGLVIAQKMRRFHLVISFLALYLGLFFLGNVFMEGDSLGQTLVIIKNLLVVSPLLFFTFVMLPEPLTAPQTPYQRTLFGAFVGFALFSLQRFASQIPFSLELSLLAGNALGRIINPNFRQSFVLQKKERLAPSITGFWFGPSRPFDFTPGQFLEYTIVHPRPDARGVRRYFTVASSPTEGSILLATKFAKLGSTFKQALREMREGNKIIASKVAGDFVLPVNTSVKLAFIAGGIGITPFRSMVQYLLDTKQSRDIVLLYGAKSEEELVFNDIFSKAHKQFGMKTVYTLERIDEAFIRKEVKDFKERAFYVSGPEPMVEGIEKILAGMRLAAKKIKRDYFPGYE